ncbi:DegV family protein [Heliorestis convoluta]|uniref:DegV family protein n=1 Tax=Heliorestis convoluta TaxID=356322 RepID=A0A5Q2N3W4_9FIRM|nr:DegV family protein [Heliorestis convoluta]QGG46960.1 DegV family protein [Heliorestis convoluta]
MSTIHLVTDSTAYLTNEEIKSLQCHVVSLRVISNNDSQLDAETDHVEFAQFLRHANPIPTTSQPPMSEFQELYDQLTSDGSSVISIHLSANLSGTYQSASMAARTLENRDIHVIDSWSTVSGLRIQLESIRQGIDSGLALQEIVSNALAAREKHKLLLLLDSLDFLHRGGRIGRAQSLFGSLLSIKPVLWLQNQGKVEVYDKIRTRKKAYRKIAEYIQENWQQQGPLRIALSHVNAEAEVKEMQAMIQKAVPAASPTIHSVGPVIAVHTGPGSIAVSFQPLDI